MMCKKSSRIAHVISIQWCISFMGRSLKMRQIDFQVYKLQTWEWCSFFGLMGRYCRTVMINDSPLDRFLMPSRKVELGLRVTHYISTVVNVKYVTLSVHNRTFR